ncbi:hypothetical protein R83H12_00293 [Fibrobacteria bacterium R8-3-H12]
MNRGFSNMAFLMLLLLCGYSLAAQEPIPQGFAAQLKAAQQAQQPQQPQDAAPQPAQIAQPAQPVAQTDPPQPKKGTYPSYEAYLDSIELIAKLLYSNAKGKAMDKLTSAIRLSQDIQPEWGGLLQQNEKEVSEYKKRIDKFKEKISDINVMSTRIKSLLVKLNIEQSDIETLDKKNQLYVKRMERACELMQDYILKEEGQVLSTERKKFDMSLGQYDLDKEEFPLKIKDIISNVPFDYQGAVKIKPRLAEIIDGETNDFTASIDYVNYPFTLDGAKVYPGAKKMHLYYENNEVATVGAFKNVDGFDWREGYSEWTIKMDSLLTGKLKYKNLDSSYAMKKVRVGPPFWTTKRIFRTTAFVLSAASLGLGYWQNSAVKSKTKKANELYGETLKLAIEGNDVSGHKEKAKSYDDKVNGLQNNLFARNAFYISAGAFGVAGMLSFFF